MPRPTPSGKTPSSASLRDRLGFAPDRVTVLSERASDTSLRSTAGNVRRVLGDLARASGPDDVLLVMLIGHGTIDIGAAKFNLVGPDLDAGQWAALVARLPWPPRVHQRHRRELSLFSSRSPERTASS